MKGLVFTLAMMPTALLIDDVSHFLKINTGEGQEYIRGPVLRVTGIKISLKSSVENLLQRGNSKKLQENFLNENEVVWPLKTCSSDFEQVRYFYRYSSMNTEYCKIIMYLSKYICNINLGVPTTSKQPV